MIIWMHRIICLSTLRELDGCGVYYSKHFKWILMFSPLSNLYSLSEVRYAEKNEFTFIFVVSLCDRYFANPYRKCFSSSL